METRFIIALRHHTQHRDDMNSLSTVSNAMKETASNAQSILKKGETATFAHYPHGRWSVPDAARNNSTTSRACRPAGDCRQDGLAGFRGAFVGSLTQVWRICLVRLLLLVLATTPVSAASVGQDILIAGTTVHDSQGRDWAYLVWQVSDPAVVRSRMFAVYAKGGGANSAALYQRQAILGIQTDPIVIQPLLQRAVHLGQDLNRLDDTINSLFETLMPDPTLPLAQKLAGVIAGSLANPDHFKNLILMSRMHPAVALCLGWAHAEQIPGPAGTPTTFEVRVYEMAADRDVGVVGRATVRAGQPIVLPAPGAPVEVHDITAKGDLNAKMRWSTPDPLRRVSMLQHGFNIYRVPKAIAEANNWDATPPTPAALLTVVQSNPTVHRLNRVPVLNPRDYSQAEAADLIGDAMTFFFSDWNDRFNPNTTVTQDDFVNGAQFYYFLTARDLLGRDGLVSSGTLMTICSRSSCRSRSS
jgi:hypothetical protein